MELNQELKSPDHLDKHNHHHWKNHIRLNFNYDHYRNYKNELETIKLQHHQLKIDFNRLCMDYGRLLNEHEELKNKIKELEENK